MPTKVGRRISSMASWFARWLVDWRLAAISIKKSKEDTESVSFGLQDAQALNNTRRPAAKGKLVGVVVLAVLVLASLLVSAGQSLIFGESVFDYILACIQMVFALLLCVLIIIGRRINSNKPLPKSLTLLAVRVARPGLGIFSKIDSANAAQRQKTSETQRLIDRASSRIRGDHN